MKTSVGRSPIEVRCLGAMSITRDDATLHNGWIKGSKELLAYLIVNRDGVPKDRVLQVIWPNAKLKEGEKLLREALYHLRKQSWAQTTPSCRKSMVRRAGRTDRTPTAQGRPLAALSLYRGEFCDDCYFSWAEQLRERYRPNMDQETQVSCTVNRWSAGGNRRGEQQFEAVDEAVSKMAGRSSEDR